MSTEQMFWKEFILFEHFLAKHATISVSSLTIIFKSNFQMTFFWSELFHHLYFFIRYNLTIQCNYLRMRRRLHCRRLRYLFLNWRDQLLCLRLSLCLRNWYWTVSNSILMMMTIRNLSFIFLLFLNFFSIQEA